MVAKPPPAESREVLCHHCNRAIDVPVGALTSNCRHCHRRVVLEDLRIKAYHAVVRLETAGKVEVQPRAQVVAEVRVAELVVKGKVKGNIICVGRVHLGKKAEVEGDIYCRAMECERGAKLEGYLHIDPQYTPEVAAKAEDEVDDGLLRRDDVVEVATSPEASEPMDGANDSLLRPKTRARVQETVDDEEEPQPGRTPAKKTAIKKTQPKKPAAKTTTKKKTSRKKATRKTTKPKPAADEPLDTEGDSLLKPQNRVGKKNGEDQS
ncbi:MAG: polymer-forming cytoskeletal protein [Planctomycetota bacterium]